jgi:hypothetical protein
LLQRVRWLQLQLFAPARVAPALFVEFLSHAATWSSVLFFLADGHDKAAASCGDDWCDSKTGLKVG